jgi:hypothetical protein
LKFQTKTQRRSPLSKRRSITPKAKRLDLR